MSERRKSGIYCIANKVSGKCYVGQAASIGDRWLTHRSHLENRRHHSRHLQAAWNKYGADAFTFSVLEYVPLDREQLAAREQFWFDELRPAYNLAPSAGSSLGVKHPPRSAEFRERMSSIKTGFRHSQETIELLKQLSVAQNYKPSPEHIEKLRAFNTGRRNSQESIEKHRQQMLGRKQPPEQIAKRVAKLIGHKTSDYTKQRIGEANRARLLGTKQSPELIEKRIAQLRGRKRPDVSLARKGIPRTPEATEAIRAGQVLRWSARAAEIKACILANPNLSITKLAKSLGADRATVSKYRKELLCLTPQPNDNVVAVSDLPNPLDI
jgi:group I intron endonuclease